MTTPRSWRRSPPPQASKILVAPAKPAPGPDVSSDDPAEPPRADRPKIEAKATPPAHPEPSDDAFDDERLVGLGYPEDEIRYIRALWSDFKQSEAALNEAASQGEWVPPKLRNVEIKQALRADLGDDDYDAMLYATRQPNRAQVGNVIASSPAAEAGLRIRDQIIRYDGDRVFEAANIEYLTQTTDPDDMIEMWVRRDGEEIELYIAGGPLGIRYFPRSETPTKR